MVTKALLLTSLLFVLMLFACNNAAGDSTKPNLSSASQLDQSKAPNNTPDDFETRQTEKLLGVSLQTFPDPQGLTKFDESPANRPALKFTVKEQPREWLVRLL